MIRLVSLLKFVRRWRVLIISAVSLITLLTASFVVTKGMVYGEELELTKIEYGNKPAFSANAVFSDVRYEFCQVNGTEWTEQIPTRMGEYKMRIVSHGVFGEKYSDEQLFSIVAKRVEVGVKGETVVYGEMPLPEASLAFGDKVYCSDFVFDDTTKESTGVTPVLDKIVIRDESGKDVTSCYEIVPKKETVTFTKRDITLTVESSEAEYSGQPLMHEVWSVTDGSLAYNDDVIKVLDGTFSSIVGVGSTENKGKFVVVRGGVDVTHHYNITQISGTLTVTQKPLVVYPNGNEFVYSGTNNYDIGFKLDETTPLAPGHTIYVSDEYPGIVDVGEVLNRLDFVILNEEKGDVTDNYSFTYAGDYLLKVIEREITVETPTVNETYDGAEHTFDECIAISEYKLADGHSFVVNSATKVKDAVKDLENIVDVKIVDKNGKDVTKNYKIKYKNGTININKKEITVTSSSLDEVYNGKPQGAQSAEYDESELCNGHTITLTYTKTITNCSQGTVLNEFSYVIRDEEKKPVTDNYDVNAVFGEMKLRQRVIYVQAGDFSKEYYDGLEVDVLNFTYVILDKGDGLAANHSSNVSFSVENDDLVNAGERSIIPVVTVFDKDGKDITESGNYAFEAVNGKLSIGKRPITVESLGITGVYYDGEKHYNDQIKVLSQLEFALVNGHEVKVKFGEDSYVSLATKDVANAFEVVGVFTEDGKTDVSGNYQVVNTVFGTLHLEKRPVILVSGSMADKGEDGCVYYDGLAHSDKTIFALEEITESNMGLVSGHYPVGADFASLTDAGVIDNTFTLTAIMCGTENVYGNYDITEYKFGKLIVLKREISLISEGGEKMYDGTPLSKEAASIGGMGLAENQEASYYSFATITNVCVDENGMVVGIKNTFGFVIKWLDGTEVNSDNYIVTEENYGTLTVTKRPISLTSQNATQTYNAQALVNGDIIVGLEGYAPNQSAVFSNLASITNVLYDSEGKVIGIKNTFDYAFVTVDGSPVSAVNYEVTAAFDGVLTVIPRSATVTVIGNSKEYYDSQVLSPIGYEWQEEEGIAGILDGHMAMLSFDPETFPYKAGTWRVEYYGLDVVYEQDGHLISVYGNYDIEVIDGYLEIPKRPASIIGVDERVEYTGSLITPSLDLLVGKKGIADDDKVEITFTDDSCAKNVGNTVTVKIKDIKVLRGDEDVTDCYDFDMSQAIGTLTVTQRIIKVYANDVSKEYYDGAPVVGNGVWADRLVKDHSITAEVLGEQINVGYSYSSINKESIVILDENGEDVTYCYKVAEAFGSTLTVEKKRPMILDCVAGVKVYNGAVYDWSYITYELKDACITPMQREENAYVTFTCSVKMINAGTYKVSAVVEFYFDGEKTSSNYAVECDEYFEATIEPIKVHVTTDSASKVYDGTPLTQGAQPTVECLNNGGVLPDGVNVELCYTTGSQTDAGSSKNTYVLVLRDINGNIITGDNIVVTDSMGTLTVEPIKVKVTTDSASKVYDGTPLTQGTQPTVEYLNNGGALPSGVTLVYCSAVGAITDAGSTENGYELLIIDANGKAVTGDNLEVTTKLGTLTVEPIRIKVTTEGASKVFDGLPLTNSTTPVWECLNQMSNGIYVDDIYATGEITEVSDEICYNTYVIVVRHADGTAVEGGNLALESHMGILEITPVKFAITTEGKEDTYSDTNRFISNSNYTTTWYDTEAANNLYFNVEITGVRRDVGGSDNTYKLTVSYDAEGKIVVPMSCFDIEESLGKLKLYAPYTVFESERGEATFNREYHSFNKIFGSAANESEGGYISDNHIVYGRGFKEFYNAGEYENEFTDIRVVDRYTGEDVTEYYKYNGWGTKFGTIVIKQKTVTITASDVVERFEVDANGQVKVLYAPDTIELPLDYLDELNSNPYGEEYTYWIDWDMVEYRPYTDKRNVRVEYTIPKEIFFFVCDGYLVEMSNYNIVCEPGTLLLSDKLIEIEVFDVVGQYDGETLWEYFEDDWFVEDYRLPPDSWLELDLSGIGMVESGTIDFNWMMNYVLMTGRLKLYTDANGYIEDITSQYEFKFIGNPLTVEKAVLVLTADSASKSYDSEPLTAPGFSVTGGALVGGDWIDYENSVVKGEITDVGQKKNKIEIVVIKDAEGNNVTKNYKITKNYGKLEILPSE